MSFGNPGAVWHVVFAIVLSLGAWYQSRRLQKKLSLWIRESFWKTVIPDFSKKVFFWKSLFYSLGMLFLALALLRPQWGQHQERIETRGMDVLFLLDLSNSMLAEDTPPSRLSRAQNFIRRTLSGLGSDRAGVIAFAGKAFLTVPLTNDFDYVADMTETLAPENLMTQGTNIGEAIDVAIRAFERGGEAPHKQSRAVILISDGEDFGENALKAAAKLKEFGAGFLALSVGTSEGGPIPLRSQNGVLQTYKKDLSQKPVLTRVNRELLAKIASAGGGAHLELINPEDAAYQVGKTLKTMNREGSESRLEVVKIERFQLFVALAMLCFLIHLSVGYRKVRLRIPGMGVLLLAGIAPTLAHAVPLDTYLKARRAEKRYQSGKFEESASEYQSAAKESQAPPEIGFNEGTALARAKKPAEAIPKLQSATREALAEGDFETAAKSLYNEGILLSKEKDPRDSFDRLTKSIELAKRTGQKELEENARKALARAFEEQQKQEKQKKEQKQDSQADQKSGEGQSGSQGEQAKQDGQNRESPMPKPEEDGKKRQFRGSTVSKDVAESLMNDLSDREKQLYQKRLGERRPKEAPNDKDW